MPRIVCVGSNLESEKVLNKLLPNGANVVGVATLPPRSSSSVSDYRDLHPLCREYNVPVVDTEDINDKETLQAIKHLDPEYIFVLGWSQLFGRELLDLPSGFVVGSHPTPLPERRGRAPVPWTILEGHPRSAVSLFRMLAGVDNGPILVQLWFDVPERPYAMQLYQIVADTLAQAFMDLYHDLEAGTWTEKEQANDKATYRAKRVPADGVIDFQEPAENIDRLVRAVSEPFPGAYTYYDDRRVRIWRSDPYSGPEFKGRPGQILKRQESGLVVQAGDQPIVLRELTIDGEPVPAGNFSADKIFGYRVQDMIYDLRIRLANLEKKLGEEK